MADGWTPHSEDEFRARFCGVRLAAQAHGIDVNTEEMRQFLMHIASTMAQQDADYRQLMNACHVPDNWKTILQQLEHRRTIHER